jgi:beta-lactamase superfamily II metal-dependent hydrolase
VQPRSFEARAASSEFSTFLPEASIRPDRARRLARRDVESAVAPKIGHVDLVQANHQGSRYSSNSTYVRTLAPVATVISVGRRSYRHLSSAVVRRWRAVGDVFETGARNGRILTTHSKKSRAYRLWSR